MLTIGVDENYNDYFTLGSLSLMKSVFNKKNVLYKAELGKKISGFCFANCASLLTITIPKENITLEIKEGKYYGAFYKCSSLAAAILPSTLSSHNMAYCFYDCVSMKIVSLPFYSQAGAYCFYNCKSLIRLIFSSH